MPIVAAQSAEIRVATYASPLSRDGPGLLLRDIGRGDDPQILATIAVINHIAPDILVLTDFDFDYGGAALSAFSSALLVPFPYQYASGPNAGLQTGLDLDRDSFTGDARDAIGYGRFLGDGGMAVLSRFPIQTDAVIDLSDVLWADIPNATLPSKDDGLFPSANVFEILPASSTAHWVVPIDVNGTLVSLLAFDATPPVFDGPEDFNGLRNRAELQIWEAVLEGQLTDTPTHPILVGNANIDPFDGDGLQDSIARILDHPTLQDPLPSSEGARQVGDAAHLGPPELDTADWSDDTPGNLRVSYVLPSIDLSVTDAGVFWPAPDNDDFALLGGADGAGAHHLVWVDLMIEGTQ